jgi:GNAT superfamily N-acetyltransferase
MTSSPADGYRIRPAEPDDAAAIVALITELAVYEREPDAVRNTAASMRAALFPADGPPLVHALVAVTTEGRGSEPVVGIAVWYVSFSTWLGRHGIWLDDFYVQPQHRGRGIGTALLAELARIARQRGYGRIDWEVLRWNDPSIGYYDAVGATPMHDWLRYRLDADGIDRLAAEAVSP